MTRILRSFVLTAALLAVVNLAWAPLGRVFAQATVNTTTLSAAITSSQPTFRLASVSTVAVGQELYVGREAMLINTVNTTTAVVGVTRGFNSTLGAAHASGEVVYTGPRTYFGVTDVSGPCTASAEVSLPHFNAPAGNVFQCSGGFWVKYADGGLPGFATASLYGGVTTTAYTASGALTIAPGLSMLGCSGACAMTIASPTTAQNGIIMIIMASTAQAHTVTYATVGFNGNTTNTDVCTMGAGLADNLVIIARSTVWWTISTRNCTLG